MSSKAFDYQAEFKSRLKHLKACQSDPDVASMEYELCRRDKVRFIRNWCMTFDPRTRPKHFPFVPYDFQEKMVEWLDHRFEKKEPGLIEKSRDMGATWIACAWTAHRFIYGTGFTALFGSRKEALVDNFTIDSLFGKMRYLFKNLPWFLNPIMITKERTEWNRYLCLKNPRNGNQITGESTNPGFGRGGRSSFVLLDEFAHVQHSEAVWESIAHNSDCVIPLSTPNGKGNMFGWLRHETAIPVLTLHRTEHPEHDQKWYEKKAATMKDHQVAQELDLSYDKSVEGRVYKRFDRKWHVAKEVIECNPKFEQFVTWDFGLADPTAIVFGQVTPNGGVEIWGVYQLNGFDIDFHIPISQGHRPEEIVLCSDQSARYIDRVLQKVPRNHKADAYGDHAGTQKTANSKRSCKRALEEAGIDLKTTPRQTFDVRIEAVDALLKLRYNKLRDEWYSIFTVSPDCQKVIDAFNNYKYDTNPEKLSDDGIKPKHDQYSHIMSAIEFLAINRFPIRDTTDFREERIR